MTSNLISGGLSALALLMAISPANAGPKGGKPAGSSKPVVIKPVVVKPVIVKPVIVKPVIVKPVVEAPWQNVRYLRVNNQSGEALTVYARGGDGLTRYWSFAPGAAAYLAIDGRRLIASDVFIWAKSESKTWPTYENESLVLVPRSYRSASIGTYTYTFNP